MPAKTKPQSKTRSRGTDRIKPYYGDFLIHPVPLEMSLNYCSHKCAYCFANLNKPDRKVNLNSILNLLQQYRDRESIEAQLLQWGAPILISNHVDPFAASNWRQFLPILEVMTEMDIPVAFQTKGGQGIDETLELIKPSVWYFTICFLNEDLRRKIEPGAPPVEERLALIEKLTSMGHRVVVGLNPAVPEWIGDDLDDMMAAFARVGVEGVWYMTLHLNSNQTRNLTAKERENLGESLIWKSCKRYQFPDEEEMLVNIRESCYKHGLWPFTTDQEIPSDYFQAYYDLYDNVFPINQQWVNYLWNTAKDGDLILFKEYRQIMMELLPPMHTKLYDYPGSQSPTICQKEGYRYSEQTGFDYLLELAWKNYEWSASPFRAGCFSRAVDGPTDADILLDEYGLPVGIFRKRKLDVLYEQVDRGNTEEGIEGV